MKKRILIGAGIFVSLLLILLVLLVTFRSRLLEYTIKRVEAKIENKYPVDFTIQQAKFTDLNSVVLSGISLVPHERDTLFVTDSVHASVSLRSILKGRIVFDKLDVANGYLTARKNGDVNNFSFLFKSDEDAPADTSAKGGRNYGELLNRLIETTFDNVPGQVDFKNLNVSYVSPNRTIDVKMPFMKMDDGNIETELSIQMDSIVNRMQVRGTIDPGDYKLAASLYASDNKGIELPYVQEKFGGTVVFDTLHLSLEDKNYKKDRLTLKGSAMVENLVVNHPKIATEDVLVNEGAVDYVVTIGEDYYSIDEPTEVRVNKAVANLQASYQNATSKIIDLRVNTEAIPANNIFESLPTGLFENLDGIKAQGELQYNMSFHVNMDSLDNLKFNSDLEASKDFKIVKWGKTNIQKINGSFVHTVYEYGKPVRTFTVGPSNAFFSRIGAISPYLRNAILTAEDAGFYSHNGFHEEAFRQAIIANLKEGEFVRGGSTISMQLVKNVFLTRHKTITRKVEEAIIVWLIENLDLVSKSRMFEVYLNIIEWGPNVYGAKDASRFYFGKQPSELNLAEAIFLTSIIPSPKRYRSSFDSYGNLRSWKGYYYRLIGGIMRRRGLISEAEYQNLYPNVRLYGRARDLIVTAQDTSQVEEVDTTEFQLETIDLLDF
ncbi:transglycosylase domain-containing protein [Pontibacter sp. KCTC 32443]|uniref:transglycosylase domain-containing protein n=1 Tax=Pontibacter TaxID=323449 RepID=UPI00164DE64F|nr:MULTISPECIES: transglycosylase domain-containing protein [Pontibacter]MBC5772440.1 transglycosylase domain-containing protein [Pontibacter sp. KCTC 32443]